MSTTANSSCISIIYYMAERTQSNQSNIHVKHLNISRGRGLMVRRWFSAPKIAGSSPVGLGVFFFSRFLIYSYTTDNTYNDTCLDYSQLLSDAPSRYRECPAMPKLRCPSFTPPLLIDKHSTAYPAIITSYYRCNHCHNDDSSTSCLHPPASSVSHASYHRMPRTGHCSSRRKPRRT